MKAADSPRGGWGGRRQPEWTIASASSSNHRIIESSTSAGWRQPHQKRGRFGAV